MKKSTPVNNGKSYTSYRKKLFILACFFLLVWIFCESFQWILVKKNIVSETARNFKKSAISLTGDKLKNRINEMYFRLSSTGNLAQLDSYAVKSILQNYISEGVVDDIWIFHQNDCRHIVGTSPSEVGYSICQRLGQESKDGTIFTSSKKLFSLMTSRQIMDIKQEKIILVARVYINYAWFLRNFDHKKSLLSLNININNDEQFNFIWKQENFFLASLGIDDNYSDVFLIKLIQSLLLVDPIFVSIVKILAIIFLWTILFLVFINYKKQIANLKGNRQFCLDWIHSTYKFDLEKIKDYLEGQKLDDETFSLCYDISKLIDQKKKKQLENEIYTENLDKKYRKLKNELEKSKSREINFNLFDLLLGQMNYTGRRVLRSSHMIESDLSHLLTNSVELLGKNIARMNVFFQYWRQEIERLGSRKFFRTLCESSSEHHENKLDEQISYIQTLQQLLGEEHSKIQQFTQQILLESQDLKCLVEHWVRLAEVNIKIEDQGFSNLSSVCIHKLIPRMTQLFDRQFQDRDIELVCRSIDTKFEIPGIPEEVFIMTFSLIIQSFLENVSEDESFLIMLSQNQSQSSRHLIILIKNKISDIKKFMSSKWFVQYSEIMELFNINVNCVPHNDSEVSVSLCWSYQEEESSFRDTVNQRNIESPKESLPNNSSELM